MPTYKGNVGHFMQHWTLCELLRIAQAQGVQGLNFIDAHAMAPIAYERTDADCMFDRVRNNLPGQGSVYEHAWHELRQQQQEQEGYPNSAAFVERVWECEFSLLLCEVDWPTIAELRAWCDRVRSLERCRNAELFPGDWRDGFDQLLRSPEDVNLDPDSLTLVSFDPYHVSQHSRPKRTGPNIYPEDLQLVKRRLEPLGRVVLIQLSTYSAKNNPQQKVLCAVDEVLTQGHNNFNRAALVPLNGRMMTMIYARNVPQAWADQLANLPDRFETWLRGARNP